MGAVAETDSGRGAAQFFHGHDVGEEAHAAAAVFRVCRDAEQAEFAELRPQVGRERVGGIDLGGTRRKVRRSPALHGVAQRLDVIAQGEIHGLVEHRRSSGSL